jgi:hypothetical protein
VVNGVLLTIRFVLELGALAALAVWGFGSHGGVSAWALGLSAPALAAIAWGLLVAPKARLAAPAVVIIGVEIAVAAAATAALVAGGRTTLGVAFAAAWLVDRVGLSVLSGRALPDQGSFADR